MGQDEVRDLLTLADIEEADEVGGSVIPDPLGFRWGMPLG